MVLVAGACVGWYFLRRRELDRVKKQSTPLYPGVAIEPAFDADSCAAVKQLQDKRFLPEDAPMLPLSECDVANCTCRYRRYKDRRSGEDRRALYGSQISDKQGAERRQSRGRRQSDQEDNLIG